MTQTPDAVQQENVFRSIPAVDEMMRHPTIMDLQNRHGRTGVLATVRQTLEDERRSIASGRSASALETLIGNVHDAAESSLQRRLGRVINATGIVLHTGLGRAVLAAEAIEAVTEVASGYSNLEVDLESGRRGSRVARVCQLLCDITGAEAALAVNNNAAATLLAIRAAAADRDVIVSRGQLIEIGGSFRLPEIMEASGARLREVGTTNRTRINDYRAAISEQTGLLLHVHPSNYRIVGFTETTSVEELVELGKSRGVPVMDDIGSGALVDLARFGLPDEPCAARSLAAGADIVMFSGDKLLGGPQAGLVLGQRNIVEKISSDPLMRTYRLDKLTLAALEATLLLHLDPDKAVESVPALSMLAASQDVLAERATELADALRSAAPQLEVGTTKSMSQAGGGSLPAIEFPSTVVQVRNPGILGLDEIAQRLRLGQPPVAVRIQDDSIVLDPRTLLGGDQDDLVSGFMDAIA
jgi:L-seryl-tRNA(Ser) seleniumtransferase